MKNIITTTLAILFIFVSISQGFAERGITRIADLNHKKGKIGTYRALIIGIQNYNDPKISDLETPLNDARAMADILSNNYGFQVDTLLDQSATKKAIYNYLRKLTNTAKPEDSILIYYAGHGDIDRTFNDGWWIPVDATGGDPFTYLDNGQVQRAMASIKAKHVLLISDSCYSGTLFGQARAMPTVIDDKYYLNLYNEKSRWGITSGNKTPVSDSGSQNHSVFAYQLIKKLKQNTKPYLSTQEIYTHIAPVIANNSEQQPLCRPIKGTGDMGGEFIFISTKAAPALQKVPSPSASDTLKAEQEKLAEQRLELERQLQELELKKLEQGKLKLALEQEKLAQERKRIDEESEKNRNNKSFQIASINPADSNTKIIARDNQYIQYKTGVVFDTRTDLEWFQGPDEELDWQQAGNWAKRLDIDGGGWRIPTMNELFSLFKKGSGTKNMTGLLNPKSWWVWCKNQYYFSNNPDVYNFYTGSNPLNRKYGGSKAKYNSVFAVRKRNPESKPKIDPHDR